MGRVAEIYYLFSRAQDGENGPGDYWVAERYYKDVRVGFGGTTLYHDWTDSRRCPEVGMMLKDISEMPKLGFSASIRKLNIIPPADFPLLRISGPSEGKEAAGGARISRSYYNSDVATWWARTEEKLQNCWSKEAIGNYAPRLNSPSDLAHWKAW